MATKYKNIVGTAFPPYVKDQLNLRSSKGGKNTKSPEELQYLTNRNAYFRLSSGASTGIEKPKKVKSNVTDQNGQALDPDRLHYDAEIIDFDWNTKLARENVLQGGIIEIQEFVDKDKNKTYKEKQKKGFSETYNQGTSDRLGLQPMPGITGITIGTGGKWQTLMQADIEFICYNLDQLNTMSKLYMSLGVNLFLEWGHIPYFDNSGNLNSNQQFLNFFGTDDKEKLLKRVTKKRRTTDGNYDAFLGTVYNFSYEADKDGAYHCKTQIMGAGGMVESLKINSSYNYDFSRSPTDEAEKFTSTLDNILYTLKEFLRDAQMNKLKRGPTGTLTPSMDFGMVNDGEWFKQFQTVSEWKKIQKVFLESGDDIFDSWGGTLNDIIGAANYAPYYFGRQKEKGEVKYNNDNARYGNATQIITDRCNQDVDPECEPNDNLTPIPTSFYAGYATQYEGGGHDNRKNLETIQTYITFGHLMALLQSFGMFVETPSTSVSQNKKTKPAIWIDYHPDNTLINLGPITATIDPYKVFVPFSANGNYDKFFNPMDPQDSGAWGWLPGKQANQRYDLTTKVFGESLMTKGNNSEAPIDFVTEDKKSGKLFNVLINLDFARDCLKPTTDESGDISLIEFVTKILDGINESLGKVNQLRTFIDESGTILRIVDEKVHNKINNDNLLELKTFGKNSIVYDSSYSSAITPKLAAQIVIATQHQTEGGIKDFPEDVLSYTSLNDNTKDRFSVYKYPPILTERGEIEKAKVAEKQLKAKIASIRRLYEHIFYIYTRDWDEAFGNLNKSICRDMVQPYITLSGQNEKTIKRGNSKETTTPSFVLIPLEYSVTMDGISGILPYNAFKIPDDRLPGRYRGRIAFVVFSINHSFDDNNWRTTLRGQTIMLDVQKTPISINNYKGTGDPAPSRSKIINTGGFPTNTLIGTVTTDKTNYTQEDAPVVDTTPYINEGQTPIFPGNATNTNDIELAIQFTAPNENNTSLKIFEPYMDIDFTVREGEKMRIGFGSENITRGGTYRNVKSTDKITNKEAYDDLERLLKTVTKPFVVNKLKAGGVDYYKLDTKMQVVTLDIAYNYGGNHKTLYNQFVSAIKKGKQGLIDELIRRKNMGESQVPSRREKEINYLRG